MTAKSTLFSEQFDWKPRNYINACINLMCIPWVNIVPEKPTKYLIRQTNI